MQLLAEHTGIEPVVFAVTGRRVNRYTNAPCVAEEVRFELTKDLRLCRFSRPVHSTTLPPFQTKILQNYQYRQKYQIRCVTM